MSEEIRTKSSTGGEKGVKMARYDLIPAGPLRELAELYGFGVQKYSERNWELGYDWSKSFAALNRHLWQWWAGEDIDEESGKSHLAAVQWHAMALLEFMETHPEFDDRPATAEQHEMLRGYMTVREEQVSDWELELLNDWGEPLPSVETHMVRFTNGYGHRNAGLITQNESRVQEYAANYPETIYFFVEKERDDRA